MKKSIFFIAILSSLMSFAQQVIVEEKFDPLVQKKQKTATDIHNHSCVVKLSPHAKINKRRKPEAHDTAHPCS